MRARYPWPMHAEVSTIERFPVHIQLINYVSIILHTGVPVLADRWGERGARCPEERRTVCHNRRAVSELS